MDLIIQYNNYKFLADLDIIWELAEDTYLLNLKESHLYLVKSAMQHEAVITPAQISSPKIVTNTQFDQNKVVLRLASLMAKYDDLSPCAFQIERHYVRGIATTDSLLQIQSLACLQILN